MPPCGGGMEINMELSKEEWLRMSKSFDAVENQLLELAYTILMKNVYEAEGHPWSPYRCISPARCLEEPGKNGFMVIWNWDTAFHSIGVSRWDTALAREGLLGFMQYQKESGIFPDVIFENGSIADTFSKPPVLAWACVIVYKRENDIEFLKKVYPMLVKNESYWMKKRCQDSLLFYDAEDSKDDKDYELHVRYESGWENSIRWDKTITDMWPIDLNCFMVI